MVCNIVLDAVAAPDGFIRKDTWALTNDAVEDVSPTLIAMTRNRLVDVTLIVVTELDAAPSRERSRANIASVVTPVTPAIAVQAETITRPASRRGWVVTPVLPCVPLVIVGGVIGIAD